MHLSSCSEAHQAEKPPLIRTSRAKAKLTETSDGPVLFCFVFVKKCPTPELDPRVLFIPQNQHLAKKRFVYGTTLSPWPQQSIFPLG